MGGSRSGRVHTRPTRRRKSSNKPASEQRDRARLRHRIKRNIVEPNFVLAQVEIELDSAIVIDAPVVVKSKVNSSRSSRFGGGASLLENVPTSNPVKSRVAVAGPL
jgi:hypothetical protein